MSTLLSTSPRSRARESGTNVGLSLGWRLLLWQQIVKGSNKLSQKNKALITLLLLWLSYRDRNIKYNNVGDGQDGTNEPIINSLFNRIKHFNQTRFSAAEHGKVLTFIGFFIYLFIICFYMVADSIAMALLLLLDRGNRGDYNRTSSESTLMSGPFLATSFIRTLFYSSSLLINIYFFFSSSLWLCWKLVGSS